MFRIKVEKFCPDKASYVMENLLEYCHARGLFRGDERKSVRIEKRREGNDKMMKVQMEVYRNK